MEENKRQRLINEICAEATPERRPEVLRLLMELDREPRAVATPLRHVSKIQEAIEMLLSACASESGNAVELVLDARAMEALLYDRTRFHSPVRGPPTFAGFGRTLTVREETQKRPKGIDGLFFTPSPDPEPVMRAGRLGASEGDLPPTLMHHETLADLQSQMAAASAAVGTSMMELSSKAARLSFQRIEALLTALVEHCGGHDAALPRLRRDSRSEMSSVSGEGHVFSDNLVLDDLVVWTGGWYRERGRIVWREAFTDAWPAGLAKPEDTRENL